jgi:ribosomal protein RSM22 (predicted rRNA methylase)
MLDLVQKASADTDLRLKLALRWSKAQVAPFIFVTTEREGEVLIDVCAVTGRLPIHSALDRYLCVCRSPE